ncbi:MAG: putative DNA binding domain-containing protein [Elusimicrobia bacterium]|nr:putative DNA binding domain-containing protein [Elusimicrobiota bacterium]
MTGNDLKARIRLGEDARAEFKDARVHPDDLAAAIVSFANTAGGEIIVGVADDRTLRGVADPDQAVLRIDNICRQNVEPPLTNVTIEKHDLDGVTILVVQAPRGPQRPYRTNKGVYYVRGAAGRRIATRQELLEIYQSAGALYPDEMAVEDGSFADVDKEYLLSVSPELRELKGPDLIRSLINMKVMFDAGHPTLAGLLCFGRDPQALRPYARITAIRHKGTTITEDFLDRREIGGSLERQIREAQDFVRQNLPGSLAGQALPIHPFPAEAVDEAIINAAAHRDYFASAQARLFVFDDRVEVASPGKLLNSVTIELMRHGCHMVRNPVVFSHLAKLRLATDAGRGIPTMMTLMRAKGLPEPEIEATGIDLRVLFRLR